MRKRKVHLKGSELSFMGNVNRFQLYSFRIVWAHEHKNKNLRSQLN